jgi:uncharacterized protein with ParB-like and HNH nuclease domain
MQDLTIEQQTRLIDANDKSVRLVLDKVKYTLDVFQREYKWEKKHMGQLLDDLISKFLTNYQSKHSREEVEKYAKYYLGSIVVCQKDGKKSIIDGQQRLTSITLLLIYLNNLQKDKQAPILLNDYIFSEKFAKKSFNLQVEDREECIKALYEKGDFDISGQSESVRNIVERYHNIEELFPEELKTEPLPYFIDWLCENVIFVEILTYSDDDAYTIFETMNDRGLNLTPAEMLKGYLLSNLSSQKDKLELNEKWKKQILKLKEIYKEEDLAFFRAWLRAKYAESIRPGKKGSENEDFEKIGTRFHSWVRDNKSKLGLNTSSNFYEFIKTSFNFYTELYIKINEATKNMKPGLESIYYIGQRDFTSTFYSPILMAPIKISDDELIINKKLALTAHFLEMFIVNRPVNSRTLGYSSIKYTMFTLAKEIRDKSTSELAQIFNKKVSEFEEDLSGMKNLRLKSQNKSFIHFLLARITSYIEDCCGSINNFKNYMDFELKNPFEVEHVWSDKYDEHKDEFEQRDDWEEYRNKIGALLLLPKDFNQSYGSLTFSEKLPHYFGQNLLAKSLNPKCYEKNPSFLEWVEESKLLFKAYSIFNKKTIEERQKLYEKICEQIYSPKIFDKILND